MNYMSFLKEHVEKGAEVSIGVAEVPLKEAHRFGILETDSKGGVINFLEKPKYTMPLANKQNCLASMGIYIFNTKVLIEVLSQDAHDSHSTHDFGRDILPSIIKKHTVYAYSLGSYWRDVGTIEAYYETNMILLNKRPPFTLFDPSWPINTYQRQLPPAHSLSFTQNSLISAGCVIKGTVKSSILSPCVFVEEGTEVSDSILLEGVEIGKNCRIHGAIIDEGIKIPNRTIISGTPISVVTMPVSKKTPVFIKEIRKKKLAMTA
jgi:glucose-1-phosphate adenylyltransferase